MTGNGKTKKRYKVLRVLFPLLLLLCAAAIFLHSAEVGTLSGLRSDRVMNALNRMLEALGFGFRFTSHSIRKTGHFVEYLLLGMLLMLTLRVYTGKVFKYISWPLFAGLAIPVMDESLQLLVPGRSGQLTDVLLDYAGVLVGILIALFIILAGRELWREVSESRLQRSSGKDEKAEEPPLSSEERTIE